MEEDVDIKKYWIYLNETFRVDLNSVSPKVW
ncbi:hypothetical protein MPF_2061 [Methanohalophilus portucalensis FDF-1]|nr:hypothetical protein MPF_2061 [Methanohalophilus portucalensis FDF-1]